MHPGEKIRQLRKARHLTQKDLVGEEITRNMLSRIESGVALPSLSTLCFLADRLGVPAGFLLDESASLFSYRKQTVLPAVKDLFKAGKYRDALRLWKKEFGEECDDESAYLLAVCATECALLSLRRGALRTMETELDTIAYFCERTVYPTDAQRATALLLRAVAANVQAPLYEIRAAEYEKSENAAVHGDLYHYLTEKITGYEFTDPNYRDHAAAKKLIAEGRYADAIKKLEEVEDRKSMPDMSIFVLFRIYGDLEHCHKELRNYEAAYRYSTKRVALLSAFRA